MDDTAAIETASDGLPNTFVDGRNALFLLYAAIYAKGRGYAISLPACAETDFQLSRLSRRVRQVDECYAESAMDYAFQIHTPLMYLTKAQTWALADEMGVLDYIRGIRILVITAWSAVVMNVRSCILRERGLSEYLESKRPSDLEGHLFAISHYTKRPSEQFVSDGLWLCILFCLEP